jgi:ferredoxin
MANLMEYPRNREDSQINKIIVDRDLCIGAISCVAVAPETYEMDNENKAVVTNADAIDDATLIASAEACPTKAIILMGKDGSQVFPK